MRAFFNYIFLLFLFSIGSAGCQIQETATEKEEPVKQSRINGISIWSDNEPRTEKDFDFIAETNADWVSFQPYGVLSSDSTGVEYNREDIWECSSFKGLENNIKIAHEKGYKVFVKPHLFLNYEAEGLWVGKLDYDTEAKWKTLEETYFYYLMGLAYISAANEVELLGIGTELGSFAEMRPEFWGELIDSVRSVYPGQLTFCANHDAYESFPHWDKLDLIGIDAYFTIDTSQNPHLDTLRNKWKPIKQQLKTFRSKYNKPLFFAEFGYTSSNYCAYLPFGGHGDGNVNLVAQANAYRALFDTFWDEPWFVGGFSWSWRFDNDQPENYDNIHFTPQNKPAADIVAKWYGREQ